jgi:signal transduction histidine kinase
MDKDRLELNILLIEDNPDFSELLVAAFQSLGDQYHLDVRVSGEEGIETLRNGKLYDVIITDYLLPGMDGIEFLQAMQKEGFDVPTIVITGQGSEQIAVKAIKLGAYDYVVKDISAFQMLPTVAEKSYRRKQLEKRNQELQQKVHQTNKELAETNKNLMLYSKELIKAERMASLMSFVRGISHELNNPLAGIVGFSELLLNRAAPGDPMREDLEEIRACAYRVKDIVSKLAKFCGSEKQKTRVINLNDSLEEVLGFFVPQAESSFIKVRRFYSPDPAWVEGVSVNLQQAFMAILVNARDAMPDGGEIIVSTRIYDGKVEASISDTGPGIEKENLDKVFSPFFSANKGEKVMGMGLAVTYGIIKENNGEIKVNSEIGQGATFTMTFPLAQPNG